MSLEKLSEEHIDVQISFEFIKRLEGSFDSTVYRFFVFSKEFVTSPFFVVVSVTLTFVLSSSLYIGVNLIVGTETGLYLLDRSGYGKGSNISSIAT